MPSLARTVFGHEFQNPVLLASGTAGYGRELAGVMDLERLGGLVTKAVSRAPRIGNPPPRVAEFPGGMLNAVGLANPGLARVVADELPWLATNLTRARVFVNVVGFTIDEYADVVAGLEGSPGIIGYELNLSCPNTSAGGIEFGSDAAAVTAIVTACRARTSRALLAKLSPVLPDIPAIAAAAIAAGADGITVVNTVPGYMDHADGAPRLGNGHGGISGPTLLAVGTLAVRRVKAALPEVPVVGVGGIRSAEDVRQYLHAGASLVAIGTAGLADPHLPARVIVDLERANG